MDIQETIRLFDDMPYETSFMAKVLSCNEGKEDGIWELILDRTLFFPEEGGQSPDKGSLNGMEVVDVQIENGIITHYVKIKDPKQESFARNDMLTGQIDWEHRFFNMQQHSGEHIFSGLVFTDYGLHNVGFHLSDHIVTMDFDGVLTEDEIKKTEWKVNQAITQNIEIDARYPSKEELSEMSYRSKIEINGPVRIVTIPGYDVCACCAPHVRRTGEIGMLKVMSVQNYKGGVRISILCGFRALEEFRNKVNIISELTGLLSTSQDTLSERVKQLKEQQHEIKNQLSILKQEAMLGKIDKIPAEQKNVFLIEKELDTVVARHVVNRLVDGHEGVCGIFIGEDTRGYRFIIGSATRDCQVVAATLKEVLSAKCGGSKNMIQGSLGASEGQIRNFILKYEE